MKKARLSIALIFLVFAALACLGSGGDETVVLPTTPPQQNPGSNSGTAVVRLVNASDTTVCYAYISGINDTEWGEDWLGDQVIEPGSEASFNVSAGDYDLMAQDCDNNTLYEEYQIPVSASGYTWTVTGAAAAAVGGDSVSVTVINDTGSPICNVFYGPSEGNLNQDLLSNTPLETAETITISGVTAGTYCTQTVLCDGEVYWESCNNEFVDGFRYALWDDGVGGDIAITNQTGVDICYIYISVEDSDSWGPDWLGEDVLANGETQWFDLGFAEYYDILMQDCNEDDLYQDNSYIGPDTTLTVS